MMRPAAPTPGEKTQRNIVAGLIVISGLVSLVYLQGTFDQTDMEKSIDRVRKMQHEPGTPTLGSWLVERTGGPVAFEAEILSGCEGVVEVTGRPDEGEPLLFTVDLVRESVTPQNEAARAALDAFEARGKGEVVGTGPPT